MNNSLPNRLSRLQELFDLPDNWYDEDSKKPLESVIHLCRDVLARMQILGLELPPIYALREGGILFEDTVAGRCIQIEFHNSGKILGSNFQIQDLPTDPTSVFARSIFPPTANSVIDWLLSGTVGLPIGAACRRI